MTIESSISFDLGLRYNSGAYSTLPLNTVLPLPSPRACAFKCAFFSSAVQGWVGVADGAAEGFCNPGGELRAAALADRERLEPRSHRGQRLSERVASLDALLKLQGDLPATEVALVFGCLGRVAHDVADRLED